MRTTLAFLILSSGAAVSFAGAAGAQSLPDPALQRAQTQAQVNQTLQQTQQNNADMQSQLQQNEARQQQQFNAMAPPAYQQPAWQAPQMLAPQPMK